MLSTLRYGRYAFIPFFGVNTADKVDNLTKTEQGTDKNAVKMETGWDRLKKMFEVNEFGQLSNEANSVLQVGAMSLFIGAIYGGINHSKAAYMEFMRSNEATTFKSHLEAKQKLQDAVTINFGKGAWRWGWRLALFSTTFVGITTLIQTYNGDYRITDYVAAGTTSGALYKFNMGPRGWIIGGGLGGVLGLCCGCITTGLLKLTGLSMKDAHYWQNYWHEQRSEYFRKGLAEHLEKQDFGVIGLHNEEVGEKGKDISNLVDDISEKSTANDIKK